MIRKIVLGLLVSLLPLAVQAQAIDQWGRTVTCMGSGPVSCSVAGLTASGATQAQALATINAMSPPQAPVVPTTISALDFTRRFTAAEQTALMAANPTWGVQIAAAGTITVTDSALLANLQEAVTAGLLTQARMTQVLNLAVASP